MIRFLLSVLFFGCVLGEGYWDIQLSPQSITGVPFGDGHISIWEHARSPGRYYAMPLVYLLHDSARCIQNILTDQYELTFDVLMWSVEAKESVYRHLKAGVNSSITMENVEMLPMEKIRIVWRDRIRVISSSFILVQHWKSNTHLPARVSFQFMCSDGQKCIQLRDAMKRNPEMFNALELEYIINGHRSARRVMTVTGSHVLAGRLFSSLNNMAGASPDGERYVNSDDLNTIVAESVSNVIASVVTDQNYVDTGDEYSLTAALTNVFKRHKVDTADFRPRQWNSTFWDPAFARPDKLTNYLNKVLSKDTSDSRKFLLNESQRSRTAEGSAGGSFLGIIEVSGSGGGSSSSQSKVQKEDVLNTLRERHNEIEWTGTVFRVKPMTLYRMNRSRLNSSVHILTSNIQVGQYETVHSIKLRVRDAAPNLTSSLTSQLVEARLMEKIGQTNSRILQTDTELKSRITGSTNEWKARLTPIDAKLRTFATWPHAGHYCVFANGNCPPGFSRHSGHMKAINQYAASGTYITPATWGNSNIKCHGRCGQYGNWIGEITLITCCR